MNSQAKSRPTAPNFLALCFIATTSAMMVTSPALAEPQGPPVVSVEVENDASNPVPVTGSLSVDGQVEALIVNGPSQAVPVTMSESLGDHVVLRYRSDTGDICSTFTGQGIAHLEFADRSVDTNPFTVPDGKTLVITNVSWQAFDVLPGSFVQGQFVTLSVGTRFGPLLRTGAVVTADIAAAIYANGNENINGGLIFRPGEYVCISGGLRVGSTTTAGPTFNGTVLNGRLVDQ